MGKNIFNKNNEDVNKLAKKIFKKMKKINVRMEIENEDWNKLYISSMKSGKGFIITDEHGIDQKKNRTENGIYSSKFCSNFGDENAFSDKYSCECRKTIGQKHEGEVCPHCGTQVMYKDADLDIIGWINLESDALIHPNLFFMIESLIGPNVFRKIIKSELETDIAGNYIQADFEKINKSRDKNRYEGIGLINFIIHFDEIIDFFISKNKKKIKEYNMLKRDREKIFIRHIPIFSTYMRPVLMTAEKMKYHDINGIIEGLNVKCWRLNNSKKTMVLKDYYRTIEAAQGKLLDYYLSIRSTLVEKKGDIRNKCLGGRLNFTSRCVIIPLSGSKVNEVELSYICFMELFKPEIINLLMKMISITISEALYIWNRGVECFDKRLYEIMQLLINKGNIFVAINRNPTIEYGSILAMRVINVYPNIDDFCMAVPLNILGLIAGDFDGDVLNILALKGKNIIKHARLTFDPRLNMQISRIDGEFNNRVSLIKDQTITLHYFSEL